MTRIAPVSRDWPVTDLPPIVQLVDSESGQKEAYEALRKGLLSRKNLLLVLGITAAIHVVDMREVISHYLGAAESSAIERDWSVMFLVSREDVPAIGENFVLVVSAYTLQVILVFLLSLFALLVTQHNLFFLRRIYQRRSVPEEQAEEFITIDLDDADNCFGFRQANQAFNVQVLLLALIGIGFLVSRFVNVAKNQQLFPDAGQVIITAAWFAGLCVAALPIWVKILPRLPRRGETPENSIVTYLREYFPPKKWPYGDKPDEIVVDTLASRFALNAFWPTGDNRATSVFFVSFLAAVYLIVPPHIFAYQQWMPEWGRNLWVLGFGSLVVYGMIAVALTWLLLRTVGRMLKYVDERLVAAPDGPVMTVAELNRSLGVETDKEDIGVFISYRRNDSAGYTGRLKEHLSRRIYDERIFYDLHTVDAGKDFVRKIEEGIATSDVMLAIIGPDWLWSVDENGQERKYGGPKGYVVFEIVGALHRDLPIIPVLVGGTEMPGTKDLPAEISSLSRFNALEVSDSRWVHDVERLMDGILKLGKEDRK